MVEPVSVIIGSDSNNNWNGLDEEREDSHVEDSVRLDRLSLEQGKMADTRGSTASLDFVIHSSDDGDKDEEKDDGEGKEYDRFTGFEESKEQDNVAEDEEDFDDSRPGPSGLGSVNGNINSGTLGEPMGLSSHSFVTSWLFCFSLFC